MPAPRERSGPGVDGVLVVDKPVGPSSHDVVVVARRALGVSRIGHTGTLDPRASGVLPLVVGQAARLANLLTASTKAYDAVVRFGIETDTFDTGGAIVREPGGCPTLEGLHEGLARFRGTFEQTPPAYSAKMVDGERAYVRAREGKPVAAAPATVNVHALSLTLYHPPRASLAVRCSAGFYVRSLAHDLGQIFGCGGALEALVRTEAAGFTLADAVPFSELATAPRDTLRASVRPMATLLTELPKVVLTPEGVTWARHGRGLGRRQLASPPDSTGTLVRLLDDAGTVVGLASHDPRAGVLQPTVVFSYT